MSPAAAQVFVAYFSPAGTTRQVARIIENRCEQKGIRVGICNLARMPGRSQAMESIAGSGANTCLFIGSPVYACHALPPVMEFVEQLPPGAGRPAVPFVTWGAVTSGVALQEMAERLSKQGYCVAAGAKILAVHSLMWQCAQPLGAGHPDSADERLVAGLVDSVLERMRHGPVKPIPASRLAYQPEDAQAAMKSVSLEVAASMLPRRQLLSERCSRCATCEGVCPAGVVTCAPYPSFGPGCLMCYNCVRLCPEKAIAADFSKMEAWLHQKAKDNPERPETEIYF